MDIETNTPQPASNESIYAQLGMSAPPGFVPIYNQSTINSIPIDLSGIDMYRQMAERAGPSTWANLATTAGAAQTANQKELAQQAASGQTAAADNALASNGGLSSGARERASELGETNYLDMSQNLDRQNDLNNLQIGINDETNKVQQLGALPGLENQAMQPILTQANMTGQENQAQNAYNQNTWNQTNQVIAANNQADATANSGGGGSFICTALREHGLITRDQARRLFDFGLKSFLNRADFVLWYMTVCKEAVEKAERDGFQWASIKDKFVDQVLHLLEHNGIEAAQDFYIREAEKFALSILGQRALFTRRYYKKNKLRAALAVPKLLFYPGPYKWVFQSIRRKRSKIVAGGVTNLMPWR